MDGGGGRRINFVYTVEWKFQNGSRKNVSHRISGGHKFGVKRREECGDKQWKTLAPEAAIR